MALFFGDEIYTRIWKQWEVSGRECCQSGLEEVSTSVSIVARSPCNFVQPLLKSLLQQKFEGFGWGIWGEFLWLSINLASDNRGNVLDGVSGGVTVIALWFIVLSCSSVRNAVTAPHGTSSKSTSSAGPEAYFHMKPVTLRYSSELICMV